MLSKQPGVAFWATVVVVVVLVAYPLSVGLAFWLVDSGLISERSVSPVYRPLAVFLVRCVPRPIPDGRPKGGIHNDEGFQV